MGKIHLFRAFVLILLVGSMSATFAQKYEIHPYIGYAWMGSYGGLDFDNPTLLGVQGGVISKRGIQIEGNFGHMSKLMLQDNPVDMSGWRLDAIGSYNFSSTIRSTRMAPFVNFGIGATFFDVDDDAGRDDVIFAIEDRIIRVPSGESSIETKVTEVSDGKTLFSIIYGGGVKAQRLWGPVGLKGTVNGRTMPRFFGEVVSSFEVSGGLLFSWGER